MYLTYELRLQSDEEFKRFTKNTVTGKIKSIASSRFASVCYYELKSGETIALNCPDMDFSIGDEINLIKVTKPSSYEYYIVESEFSMKLNALTQHSSGTPNGAPYSN